MKCYKRVASAVMGMAMAASCMAPITAYAMEDTKQPTDNTAIANHPNNETMLHSTPVYRIGAKSFYKVNDDGSVVYADQDAEGYTAVPAAYIAGSQYNDGEEYGVYTTKKADGTFQMHYYKKGNYIATARIAQHYPTAVKNAGIVLQNLLKEGMPGLEDTDERNLWLCKNCRTFSTVQEAISFLESLKCE